MTTPAAPSLNGNGTPTRFRRYELKVVLARAEAEKVARFAVARLETDRFSPEGAPYPVHSLYLDTPGFDIYNRTWEEDGTKYRIRRYGSEDVVWLERKRRKGTLVRKRRARWPLARLAEMLSDNRKLGGWEGEFKKRILDHRLGPRLLISYLRSAWNLGKKGRLTLDWGVEARQPLDADPFGLEIPAVRVSPDVILELKYDDGRPPVFGELLELLGREAGSFSKYGHGIEAAGLVLNHRTRK